MNPEPLHPSPEELFAYRDGELVAERRVVIEAHVVSCRACRQTIDEMSRLEADLRSRPDGVGERYYDRLTESVLKKVRAEDRSPRYERRKPEAPARGEDEPRVVPRIPWAAVLSTASAAVAVLIVVVVLVREGAVVRTAPRPTLLEKSAPDAGRRTRSDSAASPPLAGAPPPERSRAPEPPASKVARDEVAREEAPKQSIGSMAPESAPSTNEEAAASAPGAAINQPAAGGEDLYAALTRQYGLPPVWQEGRVSNESLERAEPGLRNLYRTGGAGADSARVRLYLAEALRVRAGASPDSAAYREIVHHYQRAIRLAGSDSLTADVALRRLREFLDATPAPSVP